MYAVDQGGKWPVFRVVRLAGAHRDSGIVCVFACYLDDSDSNLSGVITLAGYVARISAWERFEDEVEPIFRRYGVPLLHCKEFHDTTGCFSGWLKAKKKSFVRDVYEVASKNALFALSVSVRKNSIKKMRKGYPKSSGCSAYGMCFSSIVTDICTNEIFKDAQLEGVSFLVESGHHNNEEIKKDFDLYRGMPGVSHMLRSFSFVGKESSRAIQIADLFAFYSRKYNSFVDRFDGRLIPPAESNFKPAASFLPHRMMLFSGDISYSPNPSVFGRVVLSQPRSSAKV